LKYCLFIVCVFCVITSWSQSVYSVKGTVLSSNKEVVANAEVILFNVQDTLMKVGATTDEQGLFYFDDLKNGQYKIQVSFIGCQNASIDPVFIKGKNVVLNPIILQQKFTELGEVKVISEKLTVESQAGKTTYYVDENLNSAGQTALDLMLRIPMLGVDENDRVTMRGSNVTLLIDNNESEISSMLDQIPSEVVHSIDVISNPSVKYASKSGGGVVNVNLKKNVFKGFNGKVLAGVSTRNKQNISIQLGYNFSKWKFSSNFDFLKDEKEADYIYTRESIINGKYRTTFQNRNNINYSKSILFKNNLSYYFNPKSFVGIQYILNNRATDSESRHLSEQSDSIQKLLSKSSTSLDGNNSSVLNQVSTNFRKVFKQSDSQILDINLVYSFSKPLNSYDQKSQPISISTGLPLNRYTLDEKEYLNNEKFVTFKVDFEQPISEKNRIETGLLFSLKQFSEDYSSVRTSYTRTNATSAYKVSSTSEGSSEFDYMGYGLSSYGIFSTKFRNYQLSTGLRFEMIVNEVESEEYKSILFYKLLPSLHLKQTRSKIYSWEISYTSRIIPPTSRELNPIVISRGDYYKSMGNIYLKPEVIHQAEYANNWIKKKNNYNLTLFVRNRANIIGKWYYLEKDDEDRDVSYSVDDNIGSIFSTGFDANTSLTLGKIILRPSVSSFYNRLDSDKFGPETDKNQLSALAKFSSDYKFAKNMVALFSGRYNSALISEEGKQFENYAFDLGFKANLFKQKATISIMAYDILDSYEYDMFVNQRANYSSRSHVDPLGFFIYFEVSWKFGSMYTKKT
jgi:hypothetical protein